MCVPRKSTLTPTSEDVTTYVGAITSTVKSSSFMPYTICFSAGSLTTFLAKLPPCILYVSLFFTVASGLLSFTEIIIKLIYLYRKLKIDLKNHEDATAIKIENERLDSLQIRNFRNKQFDEHMTLVKEHRERLHGLIDTICHSLADNENYKLRLETIKQIIDNGERLPPESLEFLSNLLNNTQMTEFTENLNKLYHLFDTDCRFLTKRYY